MKASDAKELLIKYHKRQAEAVHENKDMMLKEVLDEIQKAASLGRSSLSLLSCFEFYGNFNHYLMAEEIAKELKSLGYVIMNDNVYNSKYIVTWG